jgi:hypothetical protein
MTPQEKAIELVFKFDDTMEFSTPQRFAKQCALIAVDEILHNGNHFNTYLQNDYWQEVKKEIEKL